MDSFYLKYLDIRFEELKLQNFERMIEKDSIYLTGKEKAYDECLSIVKELLDNSKNRLPALPHH